jgi:hypothetical protein
MYNSRTKSTPLPRVAARRTSRVPHHPSVVQKIKTFRVDYPCACGQCIHSSPLHSRNYVRSSLRTLTFHSAFILCIHLSTAQLREILISISQAQFIPFSPSPFPTHFQWYVFHFCVGLAPLKRLKAEWQVITPYRCVIQASPTRK